MSHVRKKDVDLPSGVYRRHARSCPAVLTHDLEACRCRPTYQAQAGPRGDRLTRTFVTLRDARRWQAQVNARVEPQGRRRAWRIPTIGEAGELWLAAAEAGTALTRSGTLYRPSTLVGYRRQFRGSVYAALGGRRLDAVSRGDVLALIGAMQAAGLSASTVRNAIVPLRALYRYAADHDWTTRNPTRGVAMPGVSGVRRERFATPQEMRALLEALNERDRALWATAAYAGLRRGELMGLRWIDVDLDEGVVRVAQSWNPATRSMGQPKTAAGRRTVPIAAALRPLLAAHRESSRDLGADLIFARGSLGGALRGRHGPPAAPFGDEAVVKRARAAWRFAGLKPLGLHEARHTFASLMLASGASMQVVSALIGHTTITVTVDLYGHLLPDARADALRGLDDFLAA